MKRNLPLALACAVALGSCSTQPADAVPVIVNHGNPLFRSLYTADPAPLVVGDEKMHFNSDGTIRPVKQTAAGVSILPES